MAAVSLFSNTNMAAVTSCEIRSIRAIAQLKRQKSKNKPQREKTSNRGIYDLFDLS